jgi:hypothetical protein
VTGRSVDKERSFVSSVVRSRPRLFVVCLVGCSFVPSFVRPFSWSFGLSFVRISVYSVGRSFVRSVGRSVNSHYDASSFPVFTGNFYD